MKLCHLFYTFSEELAGETKNCKKDRVSFVVNLSFNLLIEFMFFLPQPFLILDFRFLNEIEMAKRIYA